MNIPKGSIDLTLPNLRDAVSRCNNDNMLIKFGKASGKTLTFTVVHPKKNSIDVYRNREIRDAVLRSLTDSRGTQKDYFSGLSRFLQRPKINEKVKDSLLGGDRATKKLTTGEVKKLLTQLCGVYDKHLRNKKDKADKPQPGSMKLAKPLAKGSGSISKPTNKTTVTKPKTTPGTKTDNPQTKSSNAKGHKSFAQRKFAALSTTNKAAVTKPKTVVGAKTANPQGKPSTTKSGTLSNKLPTQVKSAALKTMNKTVVTKSKTATGSKADPQGKSLTMTNRIKPNKSIAERIFSKPTTPLTQTSKTTVLRLKPAKGEKTTTQVKSAKASVQGAVPKKNATANKLGGSRIAALAGSLLAKLSQPQKPKVDITTVEGQMKNDEKSAYQEMMMIDRSDKTVVGKKKPKKPVFGAENLKDGSKLKTVDKGDAKKEKTVNKAVGNTNPGENISATKFADIFE